jgi:hypothetical protein
MMISGDRNISRLLELYAMKQFGLTLKELPTVIWENKTNKKTKKVDILAADDKSSKVDKCDNDHHNHNHDGVKENIRIDDDNDGDADADADSNSHELESLVTEEDVSKRDTSFTRENMRDLLNEVDVFVLPTRGEGTVLTINYLYIYVSINIFIISI